jgi:hypothetical protein
MILTFYTIYRISINLLSQIVKEFSYKKRYYAFFKFQILKVLIAFILELYKEINGEK